MSNPIITDVIAYARKNRVEMYVILSLTHIAWSQRPKELHYNYSVVFYGETINSRFRPKIVKPFQIVLQFFIPLVYRDYRAEVPFIGSFNVSLRNNLQLRVYENIKVCVRPTPPSSIATTVCSIILDPISPYQLSHWLAYYLGIGVEKAVIYSVAPLGPYRDLLSHMKNASRVELVEWNFNPPRVKNRTYVRYGHKEAQIMSCFYRNKYASRFVLVADMDQYYFANKKKVVPSITPLIRRWQRDYPQADVYNVPWNYFSAKRPVRNATDKLLLYQNATLFSALREVEHASVSTILHPILNRKFNGILDPASCNYCEIVTPANASIRLAHFRNKRVEQSLGRDQVLVHYAARVRALQSELFGCFFVCHKHAIAKTERHARAPSAAAR